VIIFFQFTIWVIPSFDLLGASRKLNGAGVLVNDLLRQADLFFSRQGGKTQRAQPLNQTDPVMPARYASVNLVDLARPILRDEFSD
jgi:hypothetical protein